jgi:hypothetical protein
MFFYISAVLAYFEKNECFCDLKTKRGRKHSFEKLILFSEGNNMQDAHASEIPASLPRDTLGLQFNRI